MVVMLLNIVIIHLMDNTIDELRECVYDYLISNQDIPKNFEDIYKDITGESGHRCSELLNDYNATNNIFKLMNVMYTLEYSYQFVHKYFENNTVYLVYAPGWNDNKYKLPSVNSIVKCNNEEDFLSYIMQSNNALLTEIYPGSIIEYCVTKGNPYTLHTVLSQYPLKTLEDYYKLLEYSLQYKNPSVTKKIFELQSLSHFEKYKSENNKLNESTLVQLRCEKFELSKKNVTLNCENATLTKKIRGLENGNLSFKFFCAWCAFMFGIYYVS